MWVAVKPEAGSREERRERNENTAAEFGIFFPWPHMDLDAIFDGTWQIMGSWSKLADFYPRVGGQNDLQRADRVYIGWDEFNEPVEVAAGKSVGEALAEREVEPLYVCRVRENYTTDGQPAFQVLVYEHGRMVA